MKFIILLLIQLSILVLQTQCVVLNPNDLVWSDEFNSGQVDQGKWLFETGGGGWGNNELQYYTNNNNAKTENGNLVIEARKEFSNGMRYTSTRMISRQSFRHGYFEIRAKLPKGRGTWPAFWLLADKRPLNWPSDGEIDIMEYVGYDANKVHGTIHCGKYNHILGTQKGTDTTVINPFDDFHTYSLFWSPQKIMVLADGVKYFEYIKSEDNYASWPFDNSFQIILNFAVGGNWGGALGIDDTIFPQSYIIDYVRVYEIRGSELENSIQNPNQNQQLLSRRKVSIKAKVNNRFVSSENYGNAPLIANRDAIDCWEAFELSEYADSTVTLKAFSNNKFVSADNNGASALIANRDATSKWETFFLIRNGDGTYSFKALANDLYVSADNFGNSPLIAKYNAIAEWESFYIDNLSINC